MWIDAHAKCVYNIFVICVSSVSVSIIPNEGETFEKNFRFLGVMFAVFYVFPGNVVWLEAAFFATMCSYQNAPINQKASILFATKRIPDFIRWYRKNQSNYDHEDILIRVLFQGYFLCCTKWKLCIYLYYVHCHT